MKNILFSFTLLMLAFSLQAQVGINDDSGSDDFDTTPISSSAALEVRSNTRGLLLPRLTTTAINNMTGVPGMMVYDIELKCFKGYANGQWQVLGEDCDTPPPGPNTPPEIIGDVTLPTPIVPGIVLTPSYTWEDPDNPGANQTETGSTYLWQTAILPNGAGQSQFSTAQSATVPADSSGQYIRVCVTPSDGVDFGTEVCSGWYLIETTPAICKSDLIISEYVEGTSNNKYLELFNGTGADVDLSSYAIEIYNNGSNSVSATAPLSGTLADGETIVYANTNANLYTDPTSSLTPNTVLEFNGNDAIALLKSGSILDLIGVIGNNAIFAENVTLTRLATAQPNNTFDASEWIVNGENDISNLGTYTCAGAPPAGSPTVQFSETSATILEDGTTSYTVTVNLTNAGAEAVEVTIGTTASGALEGTDYSTTLSSPITIPAGNTSATFTITAIDDTDIDAGETVTFTISSVNSTNETPIIGNTDTIVVSIIDNDTAASTNPPLIITGIYDGPRTGGTPKGVELYATQDIADLTIYGIGSANNGAASSGVDFTLTAGTASAGDFIYVALEATEFTNFFGFAPDYTTTAVNINGDDVIELFQNGTAIDVYGVVGTDGTGETWDYLDGWAYANDCREASTTFTASDWTFSGTNALDGETDNATATTPVPVGTYSCP